MTLPHGVVTFLFTDVEGSTRLWEESPEAMMEALVAHDEVIEHGAETNRGVSVKPRGEGDSHFVVFADAADAVRAATEMQGRLATVEWATPRPLRVRMALHTGTADLQLGDYYGTAVNRAARLRAIAHGGQTIISASTWELVRDTLPAGVSVRDLGAHVLKDLTRPEHVYQLDVGGLEHQFPPLVSLGATPNNLPLQLTGFVGRDEELEDAQRILANARLLTILAPGGAGKTRLAIQVAAELTADFPDGVYFVDLAPITSPEDIIQAVAESVGVALSGDQELLTQLLAYLGKKRRLLVFDNFEQLVAGAGIVTEILQGAAEVKLIVTSRTKLNVAGETLMTLSGLHTSWDPSEGAQPDAVRLFVEAAGRADSSFALSAGEVESLQHILTLVDGMPLAIELAAAWVDMLSLDDIATEVARSLDFLESEKGGIPDRHRSIRAVFDYSWSLLSAEEQRIFTDLSVFRGGFTREAAEAVAGASLRNLAALVSKSLVRADRESGRYAVHELLRQYAEAALQEDTDAWDRAKYAHAAFFADRATHAEQLLGASDQKESLRIMEDDLDNMRAAWRQSLTHGDGAQARQFVFALWFLHDIRGWHRAAVSLFGEAVDALDPESPDDAVRITRAASNGVVAWFTSILGRPQEVLTRAAEAVAILSELPDLTAYVMAVQFQCIALGYTGQNEAMHEVSAEAVRRAEEAGDEWLAAENKTYLAGSNILLGNLETAGRLIAEGERVLVARGEYRKLSMNLVTKAMIAAKSQRPAEAIEILEEVVVNAREIGFRRMIQIGLRQLGDAYLAIGDLEQAEKAFVESLAMSEETGMAVEMAGMVSAIARVRSRIGRSEDAVAMLASVIADPTSGRTMIYDTDSMRDIATRLLAELEAGMDADTYTAAYTRGSARPLETTVKELLAGPV
jgi:predicted ATPase/class 3 adenylate cyclase